MQTMQSLPNRVASSLRNLDFATSFFWPSDFRTLATFRLLDWSCLYQNVLFEDEAINKPSRGRTESSSAEYGKVDQSSLGSIPMEWSDRFQETRVLWRQQ